MHRGMHNMGWVLVNHSGVKSGLVTVTHLRRFVVCSRHGRRYMSGDSVDTRLQGCSKVAHRHQLCAVGSGGGGGGCHSGGVVVDRWCGAWWIGGVVGVTLGKKDAWH
jgi:hypothetical protein